MSAYGRDYLCLIPSRRCETCFDRMTKKVQQGDKGGRGKRLPRGVMDVLTCCVRTKLESSRVSRSSAG